MTRDIILVGGGDSISKGLELNLWERIKEKEVWSINFAFMTMPYLPQREIWVDISFFKNNMVALQNLQKQGVKCFAKKHMYYANIPEITVYETTRDSKEMYKKVFIGRMGLSGFFALHLAMNEIPDNIFLLGYDFGSKTNKTHYYQDTHKVQSTGVGKPELYRSKQGVVKDEAKDFENFIRPDIKTKIWNVSPESAITCFDKITYEGFFNIIQ